MQIADRIALLVADLKVRGDAARLPRLMSDARQPVRQSTECKHRRALEAALQPLDGLQLADPYGAVPGGTADGLVPARNERAGLACEASLRMGVEQPEATIE